MKNKKKLCGVIGNPIAHSKSPEIHQKFAASCQVELEYDKYLVTEQNLHQFVTDFFEQSGTGLNVTLPFKQSVIQLVDELSENARLCQSVNTLYQNKEGKLCGETTDGDGLIMDLEKLGFLYQEKNILVIGAGGASVSVICALLKQHAKVRIINRSQDKIAKLVEQFSEIGDIGIFNKREKNHKGQQIAFDGVICAISSPNPNLYLSIWPTLKSDTFIYDLNYAERAEETLNNFRENGFTRSSDGHGMLVGQAAKSFEIWHGVMPKI
ncbi:MAG: shikimate dehydrogenase [Kangiellaceae bacterium]|nr:shikimate dehydrogenase [Kangiellaceae bacterium]